MISVGIDIGLTGAIAFVGTNTCNVEDMPVLVEGDKKRIDGLGLRRLIRANVPVGEPVIVVFEDVRPRPEVNGGARGNTMHSQGSMMRSRGAIEGVLDTMKLRAKVVQPQTWKRFFGLIGSKSKDDSVQKAIALYPQLQQSLARKKDHNRAEAVLIAHHALRTQS